MNLDTQDTIVAIASARGTSARGIVRLTGPASLSLIGELTNEPLEVDRPTRLASRSLSVELGGAQRKVPVDLFLWPNERSYTHQPSVEVHTIGSPPLLDALVRRCFQAGARLAEPGEFTLRAFLAGRLDLTQAEAVLSVIDARSGERLEAALEQLAGGLSTPLHRLRFELLDLLADLEAGLDFVDEEDVQFVEPDVLAHRLSAAATLVEATRQQMTTRDRAERLPRVAIIGPPNVGKSQLFNGLVERFGIDDDRPQALVADEAGVTRDSLVATVEVSGTRWQLIDTAGDDQRDAIDAIDATARQRLTAVHREADLLLVCQRASEPPSVLSDRQRMLGVLTMIDRTENQAVAGWLRTSALTGEGLAKLANQIAATLVKMQPGDSTAERCATSLAVASESLQRAADAAGQGVGDELVSFELRQALDGLGRVVGEVVTDEVLGEIFGKFCIGK